MIKKLISNGQPGAARAALDWAIAHGIPHGGHCPKHRKVLDGKLDQRYELTESGDLKDTGSKEANVRESDGTVVFTLEKELQGYARIAYDLAKKHGKPSLHMAGTSEQTGRDLARFIEVNDIRVLNVAGSRESEELGIYLVVEDTLNEAFPRP